MDHNARKYLQEKLPRTACVLNILIISDHHLWKWNVTTSAVGLKNSHIPKNLTKNGEPQKSSWECRRRNLIFWKADVTWFHHQLTFGKIFNAGNSCLYDWLLLSLQSHFIQVHQTLGDRHMPVFSNSVGDDEIVVLLALAWLVRSQYSIQKGQINQGRQLCQSHLSPSFFDHWNSEVRKKFCDSWESYVNTMGNATVLNKRESKF